MIQKLMEFQTIIQNYNAKSSIEPEILGIFQHKVERTPHFARLSEVRHIWEYNVSDNANIAIFVCLWKTRFSVNELL